MKPYLLVLDHGTTGIKVCLMDKAGRITARSYQKIPQIYPQPGWVEQDPMVLWALTIDGIHQAFQSSGSCWADIQAIGITNQRETTILWDKATGRPIHNAIVWQCRRTAPQCHQLKNDKALSQEIHQRSGLVIDAYFSASKIQWLMQHCPDAQRLANQNQLCFGTVDTWILWQLTGGKCHATDLTNASRTMIFNIQDKTWDKTLLKQFEIPESILPNVKTTASQYGHTSPAVTGGYEVPITTLIGDQQSALYGQKCWTPGDCKNTFGTGAFLMMNMGDQWVLSDDGLLTTIACDAWGNPTYALEGAIFIAGAALEWLKDGLGMLDSFETLDTYALGVSDNNGVYFVPAFVGLGAPHWESQATGMITGLTQGTHKQHLIRAALEAMAYQTQDVLQLMCQASQLPITNLKIDGGVSRSRFLMQFLSDVLNKPVLQMQDPDLTAKGAGYLAGLASGFWQSPDEILALAENPIAFHPIMDSNRRNVYCKGWETAVQRVLMTTV